MSNLPSRAQACTLLGCAARELLAIVGSPAGTLYELADGTTLIDVVEPDADGKTGLMFAHPPALPGDRVYTGGFPVFTPYPDDDPAGDQAHAGADGTAGEGLVDLSQLTKAQLVAHGAAQDPPVGLDPGMNKTEMLAALADAAAAADDDGDGGQ